MTSNSPIPPSAPIAQGVGIHHCATEQESSASPSPTNSKDDDHQTSDHLCSPIHPAQAVYKAFRNGSGGYFRHPVFRRLIYTWGINELCEAAGAFWMLDVIATEATPILLNQWLRGASLGIIELLVEDSTATFSMTTVDDAPPIWTRSIDYTDFPAGQWIFYLGCDSLLERGTLNTILCLPSEY